MLAHTTPPSDCFVLWESEEETRERVCVLLARLDLHLFYRTPRRNRRKKVEGRVEKPFNSVIDKQAQNRKSKIKKERKEGREEEAK